MTTAEVLRAAADHIEKHGWTQHGPGVDGNRCCASVAIIVVVDKAFGVAPSSRSARDTKAQALFVAAKLALMKHLRLSGGWAVPGWNDAPGRTAEEVIAALRGAASACAPSP